MGGMTSGPIVDDEQAVLADRRLEADLSRELGERTNRVCADLARAVDGGGDELEYLVSAARQRTPHTMAHAERVARYAVSVARAIGHPGPLEDVELAARLHDIGKLAVPGTLLTKPSPLTRAEQAVMRLHVDAGAGILESSAGLSRLAPVVLASHEWYGGGGYPRGLADRAIPVVSRLIAVCDTYDAMTEDREYRSSLDPTEAVAELLRCASTQFDPAMVTAFLGVLERH
jgi:two-component system cell cycle response regulator